MTLRTGSSPKRRSAGFTLVELMVAASILAFGTLVVGEGMLRSAAVLNRTTSLLLVERWAQDKLWESRFGIFYADSPDSADDAGVFSRDGRDYAWSLKILPVDGATELYRLAVDVRWSEGGRPISYEKVHYATA